MSIKKEFFGVASGGEDVYKYTMTNKNGFKISVLNYGAIIQSITFADGEELVAGYNSIKDYEINSPFFGAIVGRVAGRIKNGTFRINDKEYKVTQNFGKHTLHGGKKGYDKSVWKVSEFTGEKECSVTLEYISHDNEEGFPGEVINTVKYILTNDNEIILNIKAVSDRDTFLNPANHTYFNLSGNFKENILSHKLSVNSDYVCELDSEMLPNGNKISSAGSVFDFRELKKISEGIDKNDEQILRAGEYDHPFILKKNVSGSQITLKHEKSGRYLEISTNQNVVVFYTGNGLDASMVLYDKWPCSKYSALCLETQNYPDLLNIEKYKNCYLKAKDEYFSYTKYKFGIKK